ncbi:hypothetical protein LCGC14_1998960 [marine sediment metagenome]|uniref:Uncharacterized protein n=1 Tax=marine sediment metagenome TaxID=412755 RepID=A0A0F9HH85_9ZZZZ
MTINSTHASKIHTRYQKSQYVQPMISNKIIATAKFGDEQFEFEDITIGFSDSGTHISLCGWNNEMCNHEFTPCDHEFEFEWSDTYQEIDISDIEDTDKLNDVKIIITREMIEVVREWSLII